MSKHEPSPEQEALAYLLRRERSKHASDSLEGRKIDTILVNLEGEAEVAKD